MDGQETELNELFGGASAEIRPEVLGELQSILRLHSISPQELFYKWESYSLKMGAEETTLDLKTARDFKKDLQEILERESRGRTHARGNEKRAIAATPRAGVSNGNVFGMLDSLVPNTPRPGALNGVNGSTVKRKSNFDTPAAKASKNHATSSPGDLRMPAVSKEINGVPTANFADRANAGQIQETLNHHIELPEAPDAPPAEARIKLKANTEISKFSYKTMAMKLSEASEILDDRIDEFLSLVQAYHNLEDSAFGNPASQSTSEVVAVGRIASDTGEGRLNAASLVLETSRRTGAGLRVPLRVDQLQDYQFFPGKIVALRGINASGDYFTVSEVLPLPLLPPAASHPSELDICNSRLAVSAADDNDDDDTAPTRLLTILAASGPYTTSSDLDFSPLHALLDRALSTRADALLLTGPFFDTEHPLLRTGDFDLPPTARVEPDKATLTDAFRHFISTPLAQLAQSLPTISIVMCPSVRDAVARHVAWPQDRLARKDLGLPKQAVMVTNPVTLSFNEVMVGITSLDVLDQVRGSEVVRGTGRARAAGEDVMARLSRQVVEQRHFMPVFPPVVRAKVGAGVGVDAAEQEDGKAEFQEVGAMLDTSYLKLGEWLNVRPDVLVAPSVLTPFAKVVESVLVINPGTLSKRKGPGTYARMTVLPAQISDEERAKDEVVGHKLFERARVDIIKI